MCYIDGRHAPMFTGALWKDYFSMLLVPSLGACDDRHGFDDDGGQHKAKEIMEPDE